MCKLRSILVVLTVVLAGCDSPSGPDEPAKSEGELQFMTFPVVLAEHVQVTGSFWAVRGQTRRLTLNYLATSGDAGDDEFLEFEVPAEALLRRPDGSLFQSGDSIQITVQLDPGRRLLFRFDPSGLQFDPQRPARLEVSWERLNGDVDGDGEVDEDDDTLERNASLWKQQRPGEPWFPIGSLKDLEVDELEAEISSFTGFAIAA